MNSLRSEMGISPTLPLVLVILFLILGFHVFAVYHEWYLETSIWWFDIVLHFGGGAWVTLAFFYFQRRRVLLFSALPFLFSLILVVGVVMLVGVMWEWMEYGFDYLFVPIDALWRAQQGLPDTMGDLAADLVGGVLTALYVLSKRGRIEV